MGREKERYSRDLSTSYSPQMQTGWESFLYDMGACFSRPSRSIGDRLELWQQTSARRLTAESTSSVGDALMNFGGFATPERNILFDINDFDETLPAPWEWDVSGSPLPLFLQPARLGCPKGRRETAIACVRSYRKRLAKYSRMPPLDAWYARITADDIINISPPRDRARIKSGSRKSRSRTGRRWIFPRSPTWWVAAWAYAIGHLLSTIPKVPEAPSSKPS